MDKNPSVTLDEIRLGGQKLLAIARKRMTEVAEALDEGRFNEAQSRCADLYGKLTALAEAERALGVFARTAIVRAEEVKPGMYIGTGKIADVDTERIQCVGSGHGEHILVTLKWEDGNEHQYDGDQEIVVGYPEE